MDKKIVDWWDISKLPFPPSAIEAGDLRGALDAFAVREMLEYRRFGHCHRDVWVCGFGVTLWLMGDTDGAGRVWSKACGEATRGKYRYSSTGTFQPGLLLWFASVWLKDEEWHEEAEALFKKLLGRRRPPIGSESSMPLARLLRREIDLSEVWPGYRDGTPDDAEKWDALFYAGVRACEEGDLEKTRQLWSQAKERTRDSLNFEYYYPDGGIHDKS